MIRARISEVIGDYALVEIEGIVKVVPLDDLPAEVCKGDFVFYRAR